MTRRGVALLGATGSIGRATVAVLRRHSDRFRPVALSAHRDAEALDALACELDPEFVVLSGEPGGDFRPRWRGEWRHGPDALASVGEASGVDVVVNALVGIAGLEATLRSLEAGRRLALANKESLVAGGELVMDALRRGGGELLPVDSEHSAAHQCLAGRDMASVRRLVLTASGGPFRRTPASEFDRIRPEDALSHPTWSMGSKITVDSATLANKALEVIEAHHLFGLPYDRIDVVVHPSSIVHCMVEFRDGSTLAQLGRPTMEVPILYALAYPDRPEDDPPPFDPIAASPLEFEELRADDFPLFRLGVEAGRAGGRLPVAFNAANEVAVERFLAGWIGFSAMGELVERVLGRFSPEPIRTVDDVWRADDEARTAARSEARRLVPAARAGRNLSRSEG